MYSVTPNIMADFTPIVFTGKTGTKYYRFVDHVDAKQVTCPNTSTLTIDKVESGSNIAYCKLCRTNQWFLSNADVATSEPTVRKNPKYVKRNAGTSKLTPTLDTTDEASDAAKPAKIKRNKPTKEVPAKNKRIINWKSSNFDGDIECTIKFGTKGYYAIRTNGTIEQYEVPENDQLPAALLLVANHYSELHPKLEW